MKIDDALLNEAREIALTTAPELAERPLYMLRAEDVSDLAAPDFECTGWCVGDSRTCSFADVLGHRWQGPGNAIVLDGEAIADEAFPGRFEGCVRNVVLHETAHLVPMLPPIPIPPNYKPTEKFKELSARRLGDSMSAPPQETGAEHDPHGWRFCRRAIHLYVRAQKAGYDVPLDHLFGCQWWITHTAHYLPTLLSEALRMLDARFAEIEAKTPPASFMALWRADLFDLRGQR